MNDCTVKPMKINATGRILIQDNAAGAVLITGTEKVQSGYGNGDCVYLDFDNSVFAISDSTERYPNASRDLLLRFSELLINRGTPDSLEGWNEMTGELFAGQKYHHKATFSSVSIGTLGTEQRVTVIHGGDSLICVIDRERGNMAYATSNDMNFAGRSRVPSTVCDIVLPSDSCVIVLCSDGMGDLAEDKSAGLMDYIVRLVLHEDISSIPRRVRSRFDEMSGRDGKQNIDDVALIILDPGASRTEGRGKFLLGGTSPGQELKYRQTLNVHGGKELWFDADSSPEEDRILSSCGFVVM